MKSDKKAARKSPAKEEKKKQVAPRRSRAAPPISPKEFPIVGIGCSAGGLEAMERFFSNTPKDSGMAFVVIQHLDPKRPGYLTELLQRVTGMEVLQAQDEQQVEPNRIYVIPPNRDLSILNGSLHLFEPLKTMGLRNPVDTFFRSLADEKQEQSIGIILSGMGSDGSQGIKAIKETGGLALVQDPDTAQFASMPRSAIEFVVADIVAPAEELPSKLIAFLLKPRKANKSSETLNDEQNSLYKIIILLRDQSGHDFSSYKKNTLLRRIERRKNVHKIGRIQDYVRLLQDNPSETEILFKELLIGVTNFFRDPDVWDALRTTVLPALIEGAPMGHTLRAWVPACSTGEEAYSLAIIFKEALAETASVKNVSLQIFGTDLDEDAIERARRGNFPIDIATDVSPERRNRFFTLQSDAYRVNADIREMIVFAPQNVIKDPPFTKLDLLLCRNMLIYMEPELQAKLMALYNYSLNPGGYLVIGTSESLGNQSDGFEVTNSKLKIYKRCGPGSTSDLIDFPSSFHRKSALAAESKKPIKTTDNIQSLVDRLLIQQFSPPSVLVNSSGDILYITGRTGKYLEPVAGKANWNVHAMARDGLREALPAAFRKSLQSGEPTTLFSVRVSTNLGTQSVDVIVKPIAEPKAIRGMVLIVFKEVPTTLAPKPPKRRGQRAANTREAELEAELRRSLEELQSTREEMQTSQEELRSVNEELQSTNEELQSTNEELQSTNEELTTSREEMQSLNEELQAVNIELQRKVAAYFRASDDMKNLLNSTEIATLFLDKDLNVRRFTDQVTTIIKLREVDIGRPFTELVTDLEHPSIELNARRVLKTLTTIEEAVATRDGRWFNIRMMPYRTIDDRIEGLVITFTDITSAKRLEFRLKEANEALRKSSQADR